jgi:cobalt-zinc-cadmium efflux system protein
VHDLHVWSITSGMAALSCHVVLRRGADAQAALRALIALMRERHHIEHTTIQIETAEDAAGQRPVQLLP